MPQYMTRSSRPGSLWKTAIGEDTFEAQYEAAKKDGVNFSEVYFEDVQFVLSRTNHHHHKLNKNGERIPLTACRLKTKKTQTQCTWGETAGHYRFREDLF